MKRYKIMIYGWAIDNQRSLISTTTVDANDYFEAYDIANKAWRKSPSAMSFHVELDKSNVN